MYIVLLGAPGSGKGTQGGMLSEKLGIAHLSTGDLFRTILSNSEHELYKDIQVIKEGKLVSDEIVNSVIAHGISMPKYAKGIIFDGYPRTVCQGKALDRILGEMNKELYGVIDIHVAQEILLDRLLGRRYCPNCNRIFHISQGYLKCTHCGIPLVQRGDDNETTIMERLKEYKDKTAPLHNYYKNHPTKYIEITVSDPATTALAVQQKIIERLCKVGSIGK